MFEKLFWTLFTLAIVLSTSMDTRAQARGQGRPAPAGSDRADRYSPRRLRSQEKHSTEIAAKRRKKIALRVANVLPKPRSGARP